MCVFIRSRRPSVTVWLQRKTTSVKTSSDLALGKRNYDKRNDIDVMQEVGDCHRLMSKHGTEASPVFSIVDGSSR